MVLEVNLLIRDNANIKCQHKKGVCNKAGCTPYHTTPYVVA